MDVTAGRARDRRRLRLAAFAVLVGLPLMLGALAFRVQSEFNEVHQARMDIRVAMQHRSALRDVLSGLLQAESGQRDYLLASRDDYLQPYLKARASLPAKLAALVATSRDQSDRLDAVKLIALAHQKLSELDRTISFVRRGDLPGALAIVRTDLGRHLMDQVRAVSAAGRARDDALIIGRDAAADRAERATGDAALVVAGAMALTLASATWIIMISLRGRREALRSAVASEKRYRLVTDHAQDVIVQVDPSGRFTFVEDRRAMGPP